MHLLHSVDDIASLLRGGKKKLKNKKMYSHDLVNPLFPSDDHLSRHPLFIHMRLNDNITAFIPPFSSLRPA